MTLMLRIRTNSQTCGILHLVHQVINLITLGQSLKRHSPRASPTRALPSFSNMMNIVLSEKTRPAAQIYSQNVPHGHPLDSSLRGNFQVQIPIKRERASMFICRCLCFWLSRGRCLRRYLTARADLRFSAV